MQKYWWAATLKVEKCLFLKILKILQGCLYQHQVWRGTRSYSKEGFVLEIPNIVPALLR